MKIIILGNQARSMSIFWRVLMRKLYEAGHEILCLCPPGDPRSEERLRSYGSRTVNYPLNRKGLNPFQDIGTFLALKKIFLAEKPDLLFASTIKPVIYGLLAASQAKIPAIFATITGLGYAFERDSSLKKLINRIGSKLYQLALGRANGVFFQNAEDRDLFIQNGILPPDAPIRMANGTGVDTDYFYPVSLPPVTEAQALNFLFIGRLLHAKGLYEFAQAAELLGSRWPHARFQILGPMEEGPGAISSNELEKWRGTANIEYLGSCEDVRPFIAKAHVVVLPSWREGIPTSIMEAMSMERPCIVTDVPGCRELVRDGQNGFLCKAHNPADLARAMEKFLKNPDFLLPMAHKSRELATSLYDANKVAAGMIGDMMDLSPQAPWQGKEH